MKTPLLKDDAFLSDVTRARPHPNRLHLWWLGQSGFLVAWKGRYALFDPYLSDSLTKKYAGTDKPHVRITERVIAPERLDFVDVVTSSHNHTDHLDPETLSALVRVNPGLKMICPEANRLTVRERSGLPDERILGLTGAGGRALPSGPPDRAEAAGFEFRAVLAAHENLETDGEGRSTCLGFVVKAGPWTIYHAGDTVLFAGMAAGLRAFRVDVALLPINGRAPERRVAGNLRGREAAQLARAIEAGCAIPCHFDLFAFNTESPAEFIETSRLLRQPCAVLQNGEHWSPPEPASPALHFH